MKVSPFFNRFRSQLAIATILILGFGLRIWGIGFGLPNLYHPDEDAVLMPALQILKTGNLEPTRMDYGTFHIYVLTSVSAITFIRSARNGIIESPEQLPIYERGTYPAVYPNPEYFLAARLTSVLFGLGVILIVYLLGRRLIGMKAGLLAALLAAVTPELTKHSHFSTTDIPVTFWIILSLYLLIRSHDNWEKNSWWSYAGSGMVCGLAMSTKYIGVLLIVPLIVTAFIHVHDLEELFRWRVISGVVAMGVGFLVGTPFAILNLPNFLYWLGYDLRLYGHLPDGQTISQSTLGWHLNYFLTGPNLLLILLAPAGFLLSWRRWGWKRALIINGYFLALALPILTQVRREARAWLPAYPIFVLWGINTLGWLDSFIESFKIKTRTKSAVFSGLILMVSLPLGYQAILIDSRLASEDVRQQTQHWIEENIPKGTSIGVEYFSPFLNTAVWPVVKVFQVHDQPVSWFQEQNISYLILSEAGNDPTKMSTDEWLTRQEFISNLCPVLEFDGPFLSAKSRKMWIYHLPPCN